MRSLLLLIVFMNLSMLVSSQVENYSDQNKYNILFDLSYGENAKNRFDLILPRDSSPHGLAIFIHGGGFIHGDKNELYQRLDDIQYFLDNNIAIATINYRFAQNDDSLGVRLCLQDMKRAIQYIRFNASHYNIDKTRVGCYGVSAGAGSSLYFAFHDDFAVPGDSTLLGESTRIKCAGAISTQATYNVFTWKKIVPYLRFILLLKRKTLYKAAANFYGYKNYKSFKENKAEKPEKLDMLNMIDDLDPPVYLMNLMEKSFPKDDNIIQHHKRHAIVISKKLKKHHVENYLILNKQNNSPTLLEFMVNYLKE